MSNPNPILPPDPDLPLIHTRNYEVRAFKVSDSEIMLRGAVRDDKAPGLYVDGDPEPLTIHHMVVELRVSYPTFEILDATLIALEHDPTGDGNHVGGFGAGFEGAVGGPNLAERMGAIEPVRIGIHTVGS